MRRALATVAVVGGLALTPLVAQPASAATPHSAPVLATTQGESTDGTDKDELGVAQDGDDDSGRWGLLGLLGLTGLFGYKKYKDHRAANGGQRVGTVDTDGSGSRRI
ncbi:MAG: hypothetical protein JWO60_1310 [Frankiales bacterium]|nr:hypothetical protein [Frankiales bacterium]